MPATRHVLWIPKVTGSIFAGLCFACLGHEACCRSRLSEASQRLLHGIRRCGILVSDPASQRGCRPKEMFYGFQRYREAFFLACVFGLPELGLLWCLAFSDPLPTSFIFVSVQVIGCLSATVLYLCFFLRLRSCSFGTVWKGCERIVFGLPELGLLWCLAFSDPLPTSFIFVSVQVIGCLSATVLYLCFFLRLRSCSFGTVWKGCERIVFGLPELGL